MKKYIFKLSLAAAVVCLSQSELSAESLKGTVTGLNGQPVAGVLITSVSNPDLKAYTDKRGIYEIDVEPGEKLSAFLPDFSTKIFEARNGQDVRIDLSNAAVQLGNEMIQQRYESTASTASTNSDEIMKSSALNPYDALYGKVLGLSVLQNAGLPWMTNSNPDVFVRGAGTLTSSAPLVLVDGFERPLEYLVKEEIENVTVLKDAATLALYGMRGANGVILVTTKRGLYNTTEIDVSYDHGFLYPTRRAKMVNAGDYAVAANEAARNDGTTPLYNDYEVEAFRSGAYPSAYPNVDWTDVMMKNGGYTNNYNLSVRGGGKKVRYFSVLNLQNYSGFLKPDNIVKEFDSQFRLSKFNMRANLDIDLTRTTKMGVNLMGFLSEFNRPGRSEGEIFNAMYNTPAAAMPIRTGSGEWGGSSVWTENPYAMLAATGYGRGNARALFADWTLQQDLSIATKGLSADIRVAYDNYAQYWDQMTMKYRSERNNSKLDNNGNLVETPGTIVGENSKPAFGSWLDTQFRHLNGQARINYNRTFGIHSIDAHALYFIEQYVGNSQNSTANRMRVSGYIHYGLMNRYFIDLSVTGAASNKLQPKHNWGVLPAVSAAWVISNEGFMKDAKSVNLLKLRASYGVTALDYMSGNQLYRDTYGGGDGYIFKDTYNGYGGMTEKRIATQNLTYEKSKKANIGVDAHFFNILDVTVDGFYDRRTDVLCSTRGATSTVMGATYDAYPFGNDGIVDNKGVEIGINATDKVGDFRYSVGAQFSYVRSKVIEMNEEFRPSDRLKRTGKPANQIFGYEALGFFKDANDIINSPEHTLSTVAPGDIKFKDQNGDERIDELDMVALGYNTLCPEIYYSANINLEYKGIGISAVFQGVANYSAILNTPMYWPIRDNKNITQEYFDNRWIPGADNSNAKYPRLTATANDNNFNTNSVWVADRSFLKLRTCEIYYNFPKELLHKTKVLNRINLYVRGNDLLSFDSFKVLDPETYDRTFPTSASVNIGVKIGF